MTEKLTTIATDSNSMVQLIDEDRVEAEMGVAYSAVMLNPSVTWAKFILTDDKPNANRQRIPKEEFKNLIRSGIFMPIKMAIKRIADGHEEAVPLGVITHLKEENENIVALAALWSKERPEDVLLLKDKFNKGSSINVSWEIQYGNSETEEKGVQALKDVELTAATIVGLPAYAGRTPMIAFAAKKWSDPYINALPDSSFLYIETDKEEQKKRYFPVIGSDNSVEVTRLYDVVEEVSKSELPEATLNSVKEKLTSLLKSQEAGVSAENLIASLGIEIAEVVNSQASNIEEIKNNMEDKIKELEDKIAELQAALVTKDSALAEKDQALSSKETALSELQAFKDEVEKEAKKITRLEEIKTKFQEAGLVKDDEYFKTNEEHLLLLEPAAFDFMLQELASFAKVEDKSVDGESEASTKIPNLKTPNGNLDMGNLVAALKERHQIKK